MNELSTRQRYQRIAPLYGLLDLPFEYTRYRQLRPLLFEGMSGTILDAGVGTGRNFPFYPGGANVIGIDLSAAMLARALQRLDRARAAVELREMDITDLELPDQHFDNAVATFLFCVLPDEQQTPALAEIKRVLKPGDSSGCWNTRARRIRFGAPSPSSGNPGALGLWGKFRPKYRTVHSGGGIAADGVALCGWRSDQAHNGPKSR